MPLRPYQNHLRSSDDLVTSYEATRAGFVALALEKNRRSTPYVAEARALQQAALQARTPVDLLAIEGIEAGLLTAAGLSDKALVHLLPEDKVEAINGLIKNFLEPAGEKICRRTGIQISANAWRHTWRFNAEHWRRSRAEKINSRHHLIIKNCWYRL